MQAGRSENPTRVELASLAPIGVAALVYLLHTVDHELITDRTIGKMIFGLARRRLDGNRPSRGAIIVRNVLRIVDLWLVFLLLSLHFAITPARWVI